MKFIIEILNKRRHCPTKAIKGHNFWIARSHLECEKKGVVKKVLRVSKNKVHVSASNGYRGDVCIHEFLANFEPHTELNNVMKPKKPKKVFKKKGLIDRLG